MSSLHRLRRLRERFTAAEAEQPEVKPDEQPAPRLRVVRAPTPVESEAQRWAEVVAMRRGWNRVIASTPAERRAADAPDVLRAAGRADMRRWTPWR